MTFLSQWDATGQCRVFLTCREQNFDLLSDPAVFRREHFQTQRFSQMRDHELEAMVENRQDDFDRRQRSSQTFLRAVYATSSITYLHRNPLLLTISMAL